MKKDEIIELIGKENWDEFLLFMKGQTTSMIDGETNYYGWDVLRFVHKRYKK